MRDTPYTRDERWTFPSSEYCGTVHTLTPNGPGLNKEIGTTIPGWVPPNDCPAPPKACCCEAHGKGFVSVGSFTPALSLSFFVVLLLRGGGTFFLSFPRIESNNPILFLATLMMMKRRRRTQIMFFCSKRSYPFPPFHDSTASHIVHVRVFSWWSRLSRPSRQSQLTPAKVMERRRPTTLHSTWKP